MKRQIQRSELKKLAEMRVRDASILLSARRYAACYYLVGYAIECALKACIAKTFRANTIPDRKLVNDTYSHDLDGLIGLAELRPILDRDRAADPDFGNNWNVVKDWKPEARYAGAATRREAEDLYNAVADPAHGVLKWLRRHW